jgi:membrane protein involved in colicin uptake
MGAGAARREHHRQQEAMRRANEEANRQAEMMRQQQEAERRRMEAMRKAMEQQTKSMMEASKAPTAVRSTIGAETGGVSTARSRRKSTRAVGGGAAALRIPLNIGGGSGGGLNIS